MQQIIDRMRAKLDLSIRQQSDYTVEMNSLLLAVEEREKQRNKTDIQQREHIALLELETKELKKKLNEPVAVTEED